MAIDLIVEFLLGPVALIMNVLAFGFPPSTTEAIIAYGVSGLGTGFWAIIAVIVWVLLAVVS